MSRKFEVSFWNERDRVMLTLTDYDGSEVFMLVDDEFREAVVDGFLRYPKTPRPSDSDWLNPALEYAREKGLMYAVTLSQLLETAGQTVIDNVEVIAFKLDRADDLIIEMADESTLVIPNVELELSKNFHVIKIMESDDEGDIEEHSFEFSMVVPMTPTDFLKKMSDDAKRAALKAKVTR